MFTETCLLQSILGVTAIDKSKLPHIWNELTVLWSLIVCVTYIVVWKLCCQREKRLKVGHILWFGFVLPFFGLAMFQLMNATTEVWRTEIGLVRFPIITIFMSYCIISAPMFVVAHQDRTEKLVFRFLYPLGLSCLSVALTICTLLFFCLPFDAMLRQLCILCLCCVSFGLGVVAILLMCKAGVSIGDLRLSLWIGLNVPKETEK